MGLWDGVKFIEPASFMYGTSADPTPVGHSPAKTTRMPSAAHSCNQPRTHFGSHYALVHQLVVSCM
jgi:hypothetical protein